MTPGRERLAPVVSILLVISIITVGMGVEIPIATAADDSNEPPVGNPDYYEVESDQVLEVSAPGVLGNDSDPDGDDLMFVDLADNVDHGVVNVNTDGSFTYTPEAGYVGTDRFAYKLTDGAGHLVGPVEVTIEVREPDETLAVEASALPAGEGEETELIVNVTDPDSGDEHMATVDWADGTNDTIPVETTDGFGSDAVTHAYGDVGVYEVTVTVTDGAGASGSDTASAVVTGSATETYGMGHWRHELGDRGQSEYDEATLVAYLEIATSKSGAFDERTNASTLEAAREVLDVRGPGMRTKAEAQLLAAWLNFAAGGVGWDERIDTNGDGVADRAYHDAIAEADGIVANPDASEAELKRAKDLAEAVNLHDSDG